MLVISLNSFITIKLSASNYIFTWSLKEMVSTGVSVGRPHTCLFFRIYITMYQLHIRI